MTVPKKHTSQRLLIIILTAVLIVTPFLITAAQEKPPETSASETQEQSIDWKKGNWGHLASYIGTYDYQAVLDDPAVKAELEALTGEATEKLMQNLDVQAPIGFEDDCLILSGNAEHDAGQNRGFINICLYKGKIHVGLFSAPTITVYTREEKYAYLPQSLKFWAAGIRNPDMLKMSEGTVLKAPENKPHLDIEEELTVKEEEEQQTERAEPAPARDR